ncbi:hypothetical protein V502_07556, partial [Pseudogymnoascus sp. VKM F-4520 (FW-2644)]
MRSPTPTTPHPRLPLRLRRPPQHPLRAQIRPVLQHLIHGINQHLGIHYVALQRIRRRREDSTLTPLPHAEEPEQAREHAHIGAEGVEGCEAAGGEGVLCGGGGEAGEERGDGEGGVAEGEEGGVGAGGGRDDAAEVGEDAVGFAEVEGEPGLEGFDGGGGWG